MKKFIELEKIFDFYERIIFGYIVYEIETKEIKYYSYFDKNDVYTPDTLHEFDPFNKDPNYYVNNHDFFGRYKRETTSSYLPDELIESVKSAIELHKTFNVVKKLPIQYLEENEKYLAINYSMNFETFLYRDLKAITLTNYNSLENSINFGASKFNWTDLPEFIRIALEHIAKHEVDHMKVTSVKLDELSNMLSINTGFSHNTLDVIPIKTDDDGIVFTHGKTFANKHHDIENALEEIVCDYDALLASNGNFKGNYPNIGAELNRLFNGNLLNMRYTYSVNDLVAYLKQIVPSEDMAYELFDFLVKALDCEIREKYVKKAKLLINRYEQEKISKR